MNLVIGISILFLWLYKVRKEKGVFLLPSIVLLLIYFISILFSALDVIINNKLYFLDSHYTIYVFIFIFLLFIYLYPITSFKENRVLSIKVPPLIFIDILSFIMICLSLYSVIYFLPKVSMIFSSSDLSYERYYGGHGNPGFIGGLCTFISFFYFINILLFFIYRAMNRRMFTSILLLLSSTSYIFYSFSVVCRDGLPFWIITILTVYTLLNKYLDKRDKKIIKLSFIVLLIMFIPLTFLITSSRFEGSEIQSIISYIGQSSSNFCLFLDAPYTVQSGVSFPLFRELLNLPDLEPLVESYGLTYSWVFGTFIKEFVASLGLFGTILLAIVLFTIFRIIIPIKTTSLSLYQIFYYVFVIQIYSQGVFYFRYYSRTGNYVILFSLILTALLYIHVKYFNSICINRKS